MTPKMLRTVAWACFAIMLGIVAIWLLQDTGVLALIDKPLVGVMGFGVLGAVLYGLSRRSPDRIE